MAQFDHKGRWTVKLDDGASLEATVTDAGDFKFDGVEAGNQTLVAVYERHAYAGSVPGDKKTISGSFSVNRRTETLTHASNNRLLDVVNKTGAWAAATTVDPSGDSNVWMVDITYSDGTSSIVFNTCRLVLGHDESGDPTKQTVSWTCHEGITVS